MTYEAELAALPVPFKVEHRHEFGVGLVEVRRYFWFQPIERDLHAMDDALVINMALTSRPLHTRVDRISGESDPIGGDAGRMLIMLPGMTYRLAAPSGSFRSLHCAISRSKLEAIAGEPIDWAALGALGSEARPNSEIETHIARVHDELVHHRIGREIAIKASVDMICLELVRRFRQGQPARPDVHAGGLAAWRMKAILSRMHQEGPAPRVTELAALCGLTERQLSRAFKAETGMTIGRVVDEATVERAHRLLTTTGLSLGSIARQLGYASADSFAQSFRRVTGTSPSRVRQR
jgi:AraC family transcriptional regulator